MQIFHNPNFNFVKYRWPALIISWVLILAGLVGIYLKGIPLGVEFSGGTIVIVQFDTMPRIDQVRVRARQGVRRRRERGGAGVRHQVAPPDHDPRAPGRS